MSQSQNMILTPPDIGKEDWGTELNAYLQATEARTMVNDQRIDGIEARILAMEEKIDAQDLLMTSLEDRVIAVEAVIAALETRVDVLEAKPEYVFSSHQWQYSNQAPPPTGSQVRFDNADLSKATVAVFRLIDSDGADRSQVFHNLTVGSQIRINDWDNVEHIHRFNVTDVPTIDASDATVPVAWISGNGTIPTSGGGKANVAFLVALNL